MNINAKNASKGRRYNYAKKAIGSQKQEELVERKCLKCDKRFKSASKFNRICPSCAVRNASILAH